MADDSYDDTVITIKYRSIYNLYIMTLLQEAAQQSQY